MLLPATVCRMPMSELSHLTEDQIEELMDRYYRGENVYKLLEQFKVNCHPSRLWSTFPKKPVEAECRVCGAPLYVLRRSRTWKYYCGSETSQCEQCGHHEGRKCDCPACRDARDREAQLVEMREKERVAEFCSQTWQYERREVIVGDLSLTTAVALVALVRSGGWDKDESVLPWGSAGAPFSPAVVDYRRDLADMLIAAGLVAPSPLSNSEAFLYFADGEPGWCPEMVKWVILHPAPSRLVREIVETAESPDWPERWIQDVPNLWHSLAAAECWEFCALSMRKRGLPMPGSVALRELIDGLLRHFSVSHCCQVLWSGAARATDSMARRNLTRQHAANYMIGACQRMADRARAEGWDLKGFNRNYELSRSEMSHVLHDVFLQHGEDGFFRCPAKRNASP